MDEDAMNPDADEYYAQTYDASVPDWPGEIDFYREMADKANSAGGAVLEIACGTGRVAIRLTRTGARVAGIDLCVFRLEMEHLLARDGVSARLSSTRDHAARGRRMNPSR
jgi:2-polyprenyl-3-methyl-5-hydroxy-6-metoxy-1,4-benzoquinol methylase